MLLATLIAYLLIVLAFGVLAQRRTRDAADFMLGGPGQSAIQFQTSRCGEVENDFHNHVLSAANFFRFFVANAARICHFWGA